MRGAYPLTMLCEVLGYARSALYYEPQGPSEEEGALREAIVRIAGEWPRYGYRRITAQLQREGWRVNSKRVRRLLQAIGVHGEQPKKKAPKTTNSRHAYRRYPNLVRNMRVERPEQVWVADITYIQLAHETVYLAIVMDVFTRTIRGWHLSRHLDQALTLKALQRALQEGTPEVHHSDQGGQYAAHAYVQTLAAHGVAISMADVGASWQNGYAERVIRTIKEEAVALSEYRDYHDAYQQLGHFIDQVYRHKRIHSALGYLTPAEFEAQWRAEHASLKNVFNTNSDFRVQI